MGTIVRFLKTFLFVVIIAVGGIFTTDSFADCASGMVDVDGTCYTGKFALKTTSTNSFQFKISAAGTFTVNCGNGGTLSGTNTNANNTVSGTTITKSDTTSYTYKCAWGSSAVQTITFGGAATGYSTSTSTAAISFYVNSTDAKKVSKIYGSLGAIFGTVSNPPSGMDGQPRFYQTFYYCSNLTGSIPANLFAGISGAPAQYMFAYTFYGCSGLTGSIPENLFAGISGKPASYMFYQTFQNCSGLTGSIPANLFAGISGAPAGSMFYQTFQNCSGLTGSIPENLFAGISGAPAGSMFSYTFSGCSGLTGSIPENLFAGISGKPASYMFYQTFQNCSGLTGSIPANLFAGISGAPASYMFAYTFYNCTGLTGSIPSGLFGNLSGAPESYMFAYTFYNCTGLTGSIPSGLFGNLSGAPASYMFAYTFYNCTGLTGSIPSGLFGNLSDAPADYMFAYTFYNCSGLSSFKDGTNTLNYVPGDFLSGIQKSNIMRTANNMFSGTGLLSECPSGKTDVTQAQFSDAQKPWCADTPYTVTLYQNESDNDNTVNATVAAANGISMLGFDTSGNTLTVPTRSGYMFTGYYDARTGGTRYYNPDMSSVHVYDKGADGALYAQWTQPFTITTTSMSANDSFKWSISARGKFTFDCGTGGNFNGTGNQTGTISRTNTTKTQYYCSYASAGVHTIQFTGAATGYNSSTNYIPGADFSAIGFSTNNYSGNTPEKIASISGSLGLIFSTLGSGNAYQPRFVYTFSGATRLTSIPAELFVGIYGQASRYMFSNVFNGCTGLTSLPSNLFSGISIDEYALGSVFYGCTGLRSIPSGLFNGVMGKVRGFNTVFSGCTGLTSIPSGLFGVLSGVKYKFLSSFNGCTGLTSIPSDLFSGISEVTESMFEGTFRNCTGLTSIPANLFAGISGAPVSSMFSGTFSGCSRLTSIPENLFAGISGAPVSSMFSGTFSGCSRLTSIPENLFAGISGAPAGSMFYQTFQNCSGLTSIPENLFAGISGAPASQMFYGTFQNCSNLTGFTDGTNTVNYVPGNFLSGITTNSSPTNQAQNMFNGTGLLATCPSGTTTTTRSNFTNAGKPWCGTPYTLSFELNNGSFPAGTVAPTGYITEMTPKTLPTPVLGNETFGGWYDNSAFTGTAITEIPSGATGDKIYYAKWGGSSPVIIDITWYANNGTEPTTSQCTYGETLTLPPTPVRPGYIFAGWKVKNQN